MDNGSLALLHQKIDTLTEQLEEQRQRQERWDDLMRDMTPIANQMVKLTIEELDDVGAECKLEDTLYLLKRLLRDTCLLIDVLERVEAVMDLADEAEILGKQVFANVVDALDRLERKGYFAFARGGAYIAEQVVAEFDEEDAHALGDNIVAILKTARNMTQPEIMALANNALDAMRYEPDGDKVSIWKLLRELGDPKVRKGLARLLNVVKVLGDRPEPQVEGA